MTISEFKISNIVNKGVHESDILRGDNIKSHRHTILKEICHINLGAIFIEVITWDIDKRVDVKLSQRNSNYLFDSLKKVKFHSQKYKSDPYLNIFRLQYLNELGEKVDHSTRSLEKITSKKVSDYFREKHIKLLGQRRADNTFVLFAQHQYYSDSEIIEIYLISVLIPFCKENSIHIDNFLRSKNTAINETRRVLSVERFKDKAITLLFIIILFSGCYTMFTRKKIGANCGDGTKSYSTGSGTCSHHGGVRRWRYEYWWDN